MLATRQGGAQKARGKVGASDPDFELAILDASTLYTAEAVRGSRAGFDLAAINDLFIYEAMIEEVSCMAHC